MLKLESKMAKSSINKEGCEFGRVNRANICLVQGDIKEIKESVAMISKENKEMFNHFTERYEAMFEKLKERMPVWATAVITILGSLVTGLVVYTVTH